MDQVPFTVAIAFRDPGRCFDLAVRSVFAQTVSNWELLLIDDGSTDGSVELARRITDPRVRLVVDGRHARLSARLNQAAALARGRFLVRMDADDVMHPRRLATLLPVLEKVDELTVVGSWAYTIDAESMPVGLRRGSGRDDGWHARLRFIHPTVAGYTSWFRANPYSVSPEFARGQDAELWVRTRAFTRRVIVPEPLLYYREVGAYRHEAYQATATALRTIIDQEGGAGWLAKRMHLSVKNLIMTISYHCGLAEFWVRRRSLRIPTEEVVVAVSGIDTVRRAVIPGVD
jgi:glycosyltransferase involved in cell wall biosynthesis